MSSVLQRQQHFQLKNGCLFPIQLIRIPNSICLLTQVSLDNILEPTHLFCHWIQSKIKFFLFQNVILTAGDEFLCLNMNFSFSNMCLCVIVFVLICFAPTSFGGFYNFYCFFTIDQSFWRLNPGPRPFALSAYKFDLLQVNLSQTRLKHVFSIKCQLNL